MLYNFQIYDNGALVRDFIPVKNSSNAIGMFDTVSNTFFANKGRGSFTAGPEVTTPTKSLKEIHELYKKNSGGTLDYIGELYKSDGQGGVEHIFTAGYDKTLSGTAPLTLPNARAKETSWKIEGQSSQNGTPSPSSPLDVKGVGDLNGSNYVIPITISDGTATTTHNLNLSAPLQKIGTYKDSVESDGTLTVKVGKTILSAGTHTISDAMTNSPYLCTQQVSGTLSGQSITLDTGVTNADVYYVKATETETTVSVPSISTIKGTNYVDVTTEIQPSDVSVTYRSKYQ